MDQKTEVKLLGLVSFCVLMQHGQGIMGKAPDYILEKAELIKAPIYLFDALDEDNRAKVIEWSKTWGKIFGIDFEALVKQMAKDYEEIPASEFKEKYFVL